MSKRGRRNSSFDSSSLGSKDKGKLKSRRTEFSFKEKDDSTASLFETLMKSPNTRAMVLEMIKSHKPAIEEYTNRNTPNVERVKKKFAFESPTALSRRLALQKQNIGGECSNISDSKSSKTPFKNGSFDKILYGIKAYVEVKSRDKDKSSGVKALLLAMGATVKDHFSKDVTHVIFKDGSFATFQKAKSQKKHLVSVLWVEAVRTTGYRVPERDYPALGSENYDLDASVLCEKFQKDYREVIKDEIQKSFTNSPNTSVGFQHRKTIATIQTIQENWCSPASDISDKSSKEANFETFSEDIIPATQDYEQIEKPIKETNESDMDLTNTRRKLDFEENFDLEKTGKNLEVIDMEITLDKNKENLDQNNIILSENMNSLQDQLHILQFSENSDGINDDVEKCIERLYDNEASHQETEISEDIGPFVTLRKRKKTLSVDDGFTKPKQPYSPPLHECDTTKSSDTSKRTSISTEVSDVDLNKRRSSLSTVNLSTLHISSQSLGKEEEMKKRISMHTDSDTLLTKPDAPIQFDESVKDAGSTSFSKNSILKVLNESAETEKSKNNNESLSSANMSSLRISTNSKESDDINKGRNSNSMKDLSSLPMSSLGLKKESCFINIVKDVIIKASKTKLKKMQNSTEEERRNESTSSSSVSLTENENNQMSTLKTRRMTWSKGSEEETKSKNVQKLTEGERSNENTSSTSLSCTGPKISQDDSHQSKNSVDSTSESLSSLKLSWDLKYSDESKSESSENGSNSNSINSKILDTSLENKNTPCKSVRMKKINNNKGYSSLSSGNMTPLNKPENRRRKTIEKNEKSTIKTRRMTMSEESEEKTEMKNVQKSTEAERSNECTSSTSLSSTNSKTTQDESLQSKNNVGSISESLSSLKLSLDSKNSDETKPKNSQNGSKSNSINSKMLDTDLKNKDTLRKSVRIKKNNNIKSNSSLCSGDMTPLNIPENQKRKTIEKNEKSTIKTRQMTRSKENEENNQNMNSLTNSQENSDINSSPKTVSPTDSEVKQIERRRKLFNPNFCDEELIRRLEEEGAKMPTPKKLKTTPSKTSPLFYRNIIFTKSVQVQLERCDDLIESMLMKTPDKKTKKKKQPEVKNITYNSSLDEQKDLLEYVEKGQQNESLTETPKPIQDSLSQDPGIIPETPLPSTSKSCTPKPSNWKKREGNETPIASTPSTQKMSDRTPITSRRMSTRIKEKVLIKETTSFPRTPLFKTPVSTKKTIKTVARMLHVETPENIKFKTPKSVSTPKIPATVTATRRSTRKPKPLLRDSLPIKPLVNRRSTMEFVRREEALTPHKNLTQKHKKKISTIVCTKFHSPEIRKFQQIVKELGGFNVEQKVIENTTHLVTGDSSRTINVLRAIARGIWILKSDWLYESLEHGKWLPEEEFELTEFSAAVQQCRIQRQTFGSLWSMDVFQYCGLIYVAKSTNPKCSDLEELLTLGKAQLTDEAKNARIVIGECLHYQNIYYVKETWVLDCITYNKCKNLKKYILTPINNAVATE